MAENVREGNVFQKPVFNTPEWAHVRPVSKEPLRPGGPVGPEDLVDASGRCAPPAPQVPQQAAAAEASASEPAKPASPTKPPAYGSLAGDLASAPMPQGPAPKPMAVSARRASAAPRRGLDHLQPEGSFGGLGPTGAPVMGGIALGMTECQAVRRAGQPNSVSIGTGRQGERKTVITYQSGPWPGIYTFESGRLTVVDAVPTPEQPKRKRRYRQRRRAPARTARSNDVYVR